MMSESDWAKVFMQAKEARERGGFMSAVCGRCEHCGVQIGYAAMVLCDKCFKEMKPRMGGEGDGNENT